MEAEADPETEFSINFPQKYDNSIKCELQQPQRGFAVIGETIDAILVAKFRGDAEVEGSLSRWKCRVENMATSVSVSAADRSDDLEKWLSESPTNGRKEYFCKPFASYKRQCKKKKRRWQVVDAETLTCPLVAALDGLPARCARCDVHVAVWSPHVVPPSGPARDHPLRDEDEEEEETGRRVRHLVSGSVCVMSPPDVRCRHLSVAGNHHILVTVQNLYQEELIVENVTVLPNANDGFLRQLYHPILGPLAALAADSTSEESDDSSAGDVDGNSFVKLETHWSGDLPVTLRSYEAHTFPSALSVIDNAELSESQDMHLFAVLTWRKVGEGSQGQQVSQGHREVTQGQQVITHYSVDKGHQNLPGTLDLIVVPTGGGLRKLPSVTVRKPGLVITALPDSTTQRGKSFTVNYTITNNLQDFLSLRLVWNPEKALCDPKVNQSEDLRNAVTSVLHSVICHQPSCYLGSCKQGSTVTVPIGFQVLNDGVYELGQHLKLKLQYSVTSVVPPSGGHQRRGSITSTHSLPVDPRPHPPAHPPNRSASMCPLAPDDTPLNVRRSSMASAKSISSAPTPNVPTPTDNSPVHSGKTGSYGNLLDYHHRGTVQTRIHTAPSSATMSPSNRSPVQMASPASGRPCALPNGVITPQQVLKRNCQVYVMSQS